MKVEAHQKTLPYHAFHHDDSLLAQFILSEFIEAYSASQTLANQVLEFQSLFAKRNTSAQKEEIFQKILKTTALLAGASHDYMRIFSWNLEAGVLSKLNHYFALFSRQEEYASKQILDLYRQINQSWLICTQLHDLLFSLDGLSSKKWKSYVEEISSLNNKVCSKIEKFAKHLPLIVSLFSKDENVIFFVVRHHEAFDRLFFSGYTYRLLSKVYANKVAEAEKMVLKQYRRRGFEQLLPIIQEKFKRIQQA